MPLFRSLLNLGERVARPRMKRGEDPPEIGSSDNDQMDRATSASAFVVRLGASQCVDTAVIYEYARARRWDRRRKTGETLGRSVLLFQSLAWRA